MSENEKTEGKERMRIFLHIVLDRLLSSPFDFEIDYQSSIKTESLTISRNKEGASFLMDALMRAGAEQ